MTTPSSETVEKLTDFLYLARTVGSLGDAIGEQLIAWAEDDFAADSRDQPTAGAMGYIRDRLGAKAHDFADLFDLPVEEVEAVFKARLVEPAGDPEEEDEP
jgi:hypothetical protein